VFVDSSKAIYGNIQEHGGTVLPKKGQFLAIPLPAMQTRNGVSRGSAGDVKANPAAYGFVGTFVRKSVIFGKMEDKSIIPLFALKKSVTLPARRYLELTLEQELKWGVNKLEEITRETVQLLFSYSPKMS
jgi:hypothetical protein